MDGNRIVSRLKRMSSMKSMKDVKPLTHYLFPGSHCPLMGATLAVRGIKDALLMVVGTDECTLYNKNLASSKDFGGVGGRCVSVVLDTHDVTFGSVPKTTKAFEEAIKEYNPSCVFLVTTCIIEIIGDDMDSLADEMTDKYGIPVLSVHTEHFKCQDHIPGIERTITSCFEIMEKQECDNSVNILGQRLGDFSKTEVYSVLQENDVKIGLMLPSNCTIEEIRVSPKAKLNVVVNDTALPLAEKMKKRFNIPYVSFERFADPHRIYDGYKMLFEIIGNDFPEELTRKYNKALAKIEEKKEELKGITYIYGNTPFVSFEFNSFMSKLGMIPLLIQLSRFENKDKECYKEIVELNDPYVTKSANIAPLQYVYDVLKPNLYLGHESALRLRKKGIAAVRSDMASSMLGFEVTTYIIDELCAASKNSIIYKKELEEATYAKKDVI